MLNLPARAPGAPDDVTSPDSDQAAAVDVLARAVQDLSLAKTAEQVQRIVRTAGRLLVGADGATFVLRDGDMCFYVDEDAIEPLWKGQRFPLSACVSGWAMQNREQAVIEDIYVDPRIPQDAYRSTFVKSLLMTPIRRDEPIGAIGMYWAQHHQPTTREIGLARALADSTAVALQHVETLGKLEDKHYEAETDPLTNVLNRRGWDALLARRLISGRGPWALAILDLDHFKKLNDTRGHAAGDAALRSVAAAWRDILRPADAIARLGGDEFAVLLDHCAESEAVAVAARLREAALPWGGVSIGLATCDGPELPASLTERADAALYEAKRRGRNRLATVSSESGRHPEPWPLRIAG